ncbi:MAG: twin-arginine translocation signal domain-containing protein [Planctomycetes bacterium]|nr:twin-arginine translocation signal domain-containing protein [Planctomycetota bacterium]
MKALSRRDFLKLTASSTAAVLSAPIPRPATFGPEPIFSWDRFPVYLHFGKSAALLTDEEVKFVAKTCDFVCLEKGHGKDRLGSTEKGIAFDTKRLKAVNPNIKILFYWNTFLNYPVYDACKTVKQHPEWLFRDKRDRPIYKEGTLEQYNLLNPEFRRWWASIAGKAVTEYGCDGIFMDAVNQAKRTVWMNRGWGKGAERLLTEAVIDMMQRASREMGPNALLLYNGLRSSDQTGQTTGAEYLPYAHGAKVEHFTAFDSKSPESISADIDAISKAAQSGKIVIVKGWPDPDFTWQNKEKMKLSPAKLAAEAREKIAFSLACFLIAARENCYFSYSWGYRERHGSLLDYPQLKNPPGRPKTNAKKNGFVYTRSFKNVDVWVDLPKRKANIQWRYDT